MRSWSIETQSSLHLAMCELLALHHCGICCSVCFVHQIAEIFRFLQCFFFMFVFCSSHFRTDICLLSSRKFICLFLSLARSFVVVAVIWRRLHATVNPYIAFAILNIKDIGKEKQRHTTRSTVAKSVLTRVKF